MATIPNRDVLIRTGSDIFVELGVWVKRTAPWEEVIEDYTRSGTLSATDRDGTTITAEANVLPVEWLDRDGDGLRETPAVKCLSSSAATFFVTDVPPRLQHVGIYGAIEDNGTASLSAGKVMAGLGADLATNPYLRVELDSLGRPQAKLTNNAGAESKAPMAVPAGTLTNGTEAEWWALLDFDDDNPDAASNMRVVLFYRTGASGGWEVSRGDLIARDVNNFSTQTGEGSTRLWIAAGDGAADPSSAHQLRHVVVRHSETFPETTSTDNWITHSGDQMVDHSGNTLVFDQTTIGSTPPGGDFTL